MEPELPQSAPEAKEDFSILSNSELKQRLIAAKKAYRVAECRDLCQAYLQRSDIKHRTAFQILS